MMQAEVDKIMETLARPLRLIASQGYRNVNLVKNIREHVQDQCKRMHPRIEDAHKKDIVNQIFDLFVGFDVKTDDQKKELLTQAIFQVEMFYQAPSIELKFLPNDHPSRSLEEIQNAYQKLLSLVQYAKGVGPVLAGKFQKNGITTLYDLLHLLPRRYEDRMTMKKIADLQDGQMATVLATVTYAGATFYKGNRRKLYEILLEDETGVVRLKWFHFHLASFNKKFKKDQQLIVSGKVKIFKGQKEIHHPDFEIYAGGSEGLSFGKMVPVYPELGGIYQKTIRKIMYFLVMKYCEYRVGLVPAKICEKYNFIPPWKVLFHLHQPEKNLLPSEVDALERQLAFEELFFYSLAYVLRKKNNIQAGITFEKDAPSIQVIKDSLPFKLTHAQERSIQEILTDMKSSRSMNRLLQGDVGSGKTIVAFIAALQAIENGHQVALMAPTELLANQHLENIQAWAKTCGIKVGSILGKHSKSEKAHTSKLLQLGELDMVVGTHALIEDYVQYQSLGLIIIDEQHRFGVRQKDKIREKSMRPDVLIMSATPIPRSLAMTLFGDIDVSLIDEMPAGRKIIQTKVCKSGQRDQVYDEIRSVVSSGQQAFVVYPLVEHSEFLDARDAVSQFEQFDKVIFPNEKVGLIHGQMKADEKEVIMQQFLQGQIQILVSTTVIEVGIDVPNATLIVIENPERFGLAQLHQLRGRVGRGQAPGSCILLLGEGTSVTAQARLKKFSQIHNGFDLANEDLKVRGPGDFFGVAQSGLPHFSLAKFPRDLDLLESSRREASSIIDEDPELTQEGHTHLLWVLDTLWKHRTKYIDVA